MACAGLADRGHCGHILHLVLAGAAAPPPDDRRPEAQRPRDPASSRLLIVHNRLLGEITVIFGPKGEPQSLRRH